MEKHQYNSKLLQKKYLTEDVIEFTITKPNGFSFEAGQFIQIYIPNPEKEIKRSYSLISLPEEENLRICVKIVPNGIGSQYLQTQEIGNEFTISQASGNFTLKDTYHPIIFLATGVGIAPILPLIQTSLEKNTSPKIHLLFGVRHKKDIFYEDILTELTKNHPNFTYSITLSQGENEDAFLKGRVTERLLHYIQENTEYYFCGNPVMIMDIRKILMANSVPTKSIHFEMF